jgi:hypothetical protein
MLGLLFIFAFCQASIYVYSPDQLREELTKKSHHATISASLGNFGNPPYGSSILGRVFWPGTAQEDGCRALSPINYSSETDPSNSPILLLKRGGCSFVQKVRHAQDIGAAAVVVYNNKNDNVDSIVMTDDGTAGNLYIPAFLISKQDGELMVKYLDDPEYTSRVSLQLSFEMNHPGTYVEYLIWMTPDHTAIRQFLYDFAPSANKFKEDETIFTPQYVLWYCLECRRDNFTAPHQDCFSGGRFCAPDPDGSGSMSGRDILYEDLRQLCIYEQYKKGMMDKWWDYVYHLYSTCPNAEFSVACSHKAMDKAGIDVPAVDACVEQSFSSSNHATAQNSILAAQRDKFLESGIFYFPIIQINNQTFRGDLEYDEIRLAICAGFKTRPKICYEWDGYDFNPESKDGSSDRGISVSTLLLILAVGVTVLVLGMFFVWRWIRSAMQKEMQREVSQYIALAETSVNREI